MALRPGLVVWCLLLAFGGAAAQAGDWDALHAQAIEAHAAGDAARLQALMEQALPLRPGHPRTRYNLAAAHALQGRAEAVWPLLEGLARQGIHYDLDADGDFLALRDRPEYAAAREAFARNLRRVGRARLGFVGGVPRFIPDGLAYDRFEDTYYLASARERRILRVDRLRERRPLVQPGQQGLWSALGLQLDSNRRRLWVASSALPWMEGWRPELAGQAQILVFDTTNGRRVARYQPSGTGPHEFRELALAGRDRVYVVDRAQAMVYRLAVRERRFEPLLPPGSLIEPMGLSLSRDGRALYIADHEQGLFHYDLTSGTLERMALPRPEAFTPYGYQRVYADRGSLVVVQTGIRPHRIVQFRLSADGRQLVDGRTLLANDRDLDHPAGGVISGGVFHVVANGQQHRIVDGRVPAAAALRRPVVLTLDLRRPWPAPDAPAADPEDDEDNDDARASPAPGDDD